MHMYIKMIIFTRNQIVMWNKKRVLKSFIMVSGIRIFIKNALGFFIIGFFLPQPRLFHFGARTTHLEAGHRSLCSLQDSISTHQAIFPTPPMLTRYCNALFYILFPNVIVPSIFYENSYAHKPHKRSRF